MADMDFDDYRAMVEESPVETAIIEFRDDSADGRLVGACLVDWLSSGVSAVYSYFDPQDPRRGLGTYMILWLAERPPGAACLTSISATGSPIPARWPTSAPSGRSSSSARGLDELPTRVGNSRTWAT
jgi:hypothetical protein